MHVLHKTQRAQGSANVEGGVRPSSMHAAAVEPQKWRGQRPVLSMKTLELEAGDAARVASIMRTA